MALKYRACLVGRGKQILAGIRKTVYLPGSCMGQAHADEEEREYDMGTGGGSWEWQGASYKESRRDVRAGYV